MENVFFEGTLQRQPKLGYIYESKDFLTGSLVNGLKDSYDPSLIKSSKKEQYLDAELGWFSVFRETIYGCSVVDEYNSNHYNLDDSFKAFSVVTSA